jgi:hypothetical protein
MGRRSTFIIIRPSSEEVSNRRFRSTSGLASRGHRAGTNVGDTNLVSEPRFVFLDLNHWIYLAKAYQGKPHRPAHEDLLAPLLAAVGRDEVRLPINYLHLIELARSSRNERRTDLGTIFELFGRGWYIAAWSHILPREFDRAVAKVLELATIPPLPEVFGRGLYFGLPPSSRVQLRHELGPSAFAELERIAQLPGATLDVVSSPSEENRHRQNASIAARAVKDTDAIEKDRQAFRSDPKEVHRRAKMAEYIRSFHDQLASSLSSVGYNLDSFFSRGPEFVVRFWSEVPSLHADCELTLYRDRQWSRAVDPNDIVDIAHIALTVPYCSAVVVERFWARALKETGVAQKYGTAVCTDLEELRAFISA